MFLIYRVGGVTAGNDTRGYMKFSADGTKLAFAAFVNCFVDLFDFDAATGIVSNEKYLTLPSSSQGPQGLEFSISGHYLYTCFQLPVDIYQWDISSNSAAIINSTLLQIGTSTSPYLGAMQMAPDGKIYIARYGENFLDAINSPEMPGTLCNFANNAFQLNGTLCHLGLPNYGSSYFLPTGINTNNPQLNELTVYPNPVSDNIYISFPANEKEIVTIKIYSITGEVVLEKENKNTAPITLIIQLPITQIPNELYFLSVQTGRENITRKIIVNH